MQHRRPRMSKPAKTLLASAVALTAAAGVTVAQAGEAGRKCTAFDTVTLGKYYVNNNLWGQDKATGSQCVWDNSRSGSTISWGTNYSWANNSKGTDSDVKSYASTVLGWHWGWKVDKASTGLPIRVGDRKPVRTTWDFTLPSTPGTMNVSYDLWLHAKNTADWQDQPTDEVMIWLNRQGGAGPSAPSTAASASAAPSGTSTRATSAGTSTPSSAAPTPPGRRSTWTTSPRHSSGASS